MKVVKNAPPAKPGRCVIDGKSMMGQWDPHARQFFMVVDNRIGTKTVNRDEVKAQRYAEMYDGRPTSSPPTAIVDHMGSDETFKIDDSKKIAPLADYDLTDEADDKLADYDTGTLRKYAGKVLGIVGASKIPGGKPALIERIIEVRRG